jgi:uncharacterized protein (AIM24 family)
MADEYRVKIDERAGTGMRFELFQLARKVHSTLPVAVSAGANSGLIHLPNPVAQTARQLRIVLDGGAALLEPGALQYAMGKLAIEVQKNERGNFLTRAIASAGTGESGFATRYAGHGEVWTEPTTKHFIIAAMEGSDDALILDDKAFYACEGSVVIKTHVHRTIAGVLSGNGLMQPKLEGAGAFVVESPVPVEEIESVELDGSGELIVDGDLMLMYSASLSVELRPLVRGLRNAMRSGEGLVFVFKGRGTVWLTPTARLGGL